MKRCLPRTPKVEPLAGYVPAPSRGKATAEPIRLDFCPRTGTCITLAEIQGWPALSCNMCPIYIKLEDFINSRTKEAILLEAITANWSERQGKTSTG